ncbi:hypothetical protein QVA66_04195 [Staphylococcus chromogenes]|nr:hypothetical protein [Staphylococcus chromogenes]
MKLIWFGFASSTVANFCLVLVWLLERRFHQMPEMMPIPIALSLWCAVWLSLKKPAAQDFAPAISGVAVLFSLAIVVGLLIGVRNFWGLEFLVVLGAIAPLSLVKGTKSS